MINNTGASSQCPDEKRGQSAFTIGKQIQIIFFITRQITWLWMNMNAGDDFSVLCCVTAWRLHRGSSWQDWQPNGGCQIYLSFFSFALKDETRREFRFCLQWFLLSASLNYCVRKTTTNIWGKSDYSKNVNILERIEK